MMRRSGGRDQGSFWEDWGVWWAQNTLGHKFRVTLDFALPCKSARLPGSFQICLFPSPHFFLFKYF